MRLGHLGQPLSLALEEAKDHQMAYIARLMSKEYQATIRIKAPLPSDLPQQHVVIKKDFYKKKTPNIKNQFDKTEKDLTLPDVFDPQDKPKDYSFIDLEDEK